ncbi:hypothetical protein BK816_02565 [Boudabousia tangfeifanii]|uniref:ABC transporter domain-containing protein n=1 Tax=Boudabousia tangfeifanii TaxID=1912795 RepID=A0A1D9MMQ6_9ACTO|nr:hypothetical protein BK816_02565 [Boudabousia tangfeifanii]
MTLARGKTTAIVGPSGCGKSTLLRILAGLSTPSSGQIEINGQIVSDLSGYTALMPQTDALYPWLRVEDNVALASAIAGVDKGARRQSASAILTELGLEKWAKAWPVELSGGMRQRVSFARTLLSHRPLLALDEPFGALDALTREEIQNWFSSQVAKRGLTTVVVTHDISEAVRLGHAVVVLSERPARVVAAWQWPDLPDYQSSAGTLEASQRIAKVRAALSAN